jgi:hypothetical protein
MRAVVLGAALISAVLAGCAVPPGGGDGAGSGRSCERLFRDFDIADRSVRTFGRGERVTIPPALAARGQDLRRAGCITSTSQLFGLEALGADLRGTVQGESGAPIRPIALHVGVVTSMGDEIRVRAFFEALGFRVRSIGNIAIGRRIYLGPFATEGGLAEATAIARRAGFVAPYPKFF